MTALLIHFYDHEVHIFTDTLFVTEGSSREVLTYAQKVHSIERSGLVVTGTGYVELIRRWRNLLEGEEGVDAIDELPRLSRDAEIMSRSVLASRPTAEHKSTVLTLGFSEEEGRYRLFRFGTASSFQIEELKAPCVFAIPCDDKSQDPRGAETHDDILAWFNERARENIVNGVPLVGGSAWGYSFDLERKTWGEIGKIEDGLG